MTGAFRVELPRDWSSVERAYALVVDALATALHPDDLSTVAMVVSELVENAVKYGDTVGPIDVSVSLLGERVSVVVGCHPRGEPHASRLRQMVDDIGAAPTPEAAMLARIDAVSCTHSGLGLARIAYEAGADLNVEADGARLRVRAAFRTTPPERAATEFDDQEADP